MGYYDYAPYLDMSGVVIAFYLIYLVVALAASVGLYVMQSLGLYKVSVRRGIKKPWLAWIPIGNLWILGCISDQYQYVVKGKVKNKRKALLILNVFMYVLLAALVVLYVALIVVIFESQNPMGKDFALLMGIVPVSLAMSGISIAVTVIQYIALYDLFASCDPENKVLYLVLSILVPITQPIFMLVCRNKDLGMPPRRVVNPEPQQEPSAWQPNQPPKEPWENHNEE